MDKLDPSNSSGNDLHLATDLARRLARYRRRVEAEGRERSLRTIDRAIEDAGTIGRPRSGKLPRGTS